MTAPKPDFLDLLLTVWRKDVESVPFPDFADLLIPRSQRRGRHVVSPECWCEPLAAPGRWQHRGPLPHIFEPAIGDDITRAGQPTAIHQ
jgi:hypothetical protein